MWDQVEAQQIIIQKPELIIEICNTVTHFLTFCDSFLYVFSGEFFEGGGLALLEWTPPTLEGICHLCTCQEKESLSSHNLKAECHVQVQKKRHYSNDYKQCTLDIAVTLTVKHRVISPATVSHTRTNVAAFVLKTTPSLCNTVFSLF